MSINISIYYDYILERLSTLAVAINTNGKLNILNLHNHAEIFYRDFFNKLYGWKLRNINNDQQNNESIDLICDTNKILIQVSATCSKNKIESSLNREFINEHKNYHFKFISISKDSSLLRKKDYSNPFGILFEPEKDIYDLEFIMRDVYNLDIDNQKLIYEFIKKELGREVDINKLSSNLANVINILSKEDLNKNNQPINIDVFEIDRKISFNNLDIAKLTIEDYRIYHSTVDKIYSVYDTSGVNKSSSVLATIRKEYIENSTIKNDNELFFKVISNIQEKIVNSSNFIEIPIDELEMCINALVVDAFIRCKIFKNPKDYTYVVTR